MIRQALWDQRMIDELKKKRERLFSERSSPRLLAELRRRLQSTTRDIYMVRSIAEQGEDMTCSSIKPPLCTLKYLETRKMEIPYSRRVLLRNT